MRIFLITLMLLSACGREIDIYHSHTNPVNRVDLTADYDEAVRICALLKSDITTIVSDNFGSGLEINLNIHDQDAYLLDSSGNLIYLSDGSYSWMQACTLTIQNGQLINVQ